MSDVPLADKTPLARRMPWNPDSKPEAQNRAWHQIFDERHTASSRFPPARWRSARDLDNRRMIPAYIEARMRRPPPPDFCILAGSTPVVSFGNARTATVATLGLNPSRLEFLDNDGLELVGDARRLATHLSLGTTELATASSESIAQVLADCNGYFQRRPYRWFRCFRPILNACGASFEDGTACHLDLVQWATDPTWGKLRPASTRKQLVADDASFLSEQLQNERLRLLLVNGMSVLRELKRTIAPDLDELEPIIGYAHFDTRLFSATVFERVRVIGWSTNLQSSFGVTTELLEELASRVGGLASDGKLVSPN